MNGTDGSDGVAFGCAHSILNAEKSLNKYTFENFWSWTNRMMRGERGRCGVTVCEGVAELLAALYCTTRRAEILSNWIFFNFLCFFIFHFIQDRFEFKKYFWHAQQLFEEIALLFVANFNFLVQLV